MTNYATLEEAYQVTSFKKQKKSKKASNDVSKPISKPPTVKDIEPYDPKINVNHCDPLSAPPYIFPIEEKAKQQYDEALRNMNIAATNSTIQTNNNNDNDNDNVTIDNLGYDNDNDDLDEYLPNVEDYVENIEEKPRLLTSSIENTPDVRNSKDIKNIKDIKDARLYEFLILFTIGMVIIFLCEILVRLASS